ESGPGCSAYYSRALLSPTYLLNTTEPSPRVVLLSTSRCMVTTNATTWSTSSATTVGAGSSNSIGGRLNTFRTEVRPGGPLTRARHDDSFVASRCVTWTGSNQGGECQRGSAQARRKVLCIHDALRAIHDALRAGPGFPGYGVS